MVFHTRPKNFNYDKDLCPIILFGSLKDLRSVVLSQRLVIYGRRFTVSPLYAVCSLRSAACSVQMSDSYTGSESDKNRESGRQLI